MNHDSRPLKGWLSMADFRIDNDVLTQLYSFILPIGLRFHAGEEIMRCRDRNCKKHTIGLLLNRSAGYIITSMILDQIKQRLHNGFHPFSIRLSDGREFTVPQRDFIALHPKVLVVIDEN